ncbi:MAG: 30S ribosomal protein S20 [Acidobacteriota bacterium]|nr:30S ribosomal protein S20 [Acidobacteriota bacterium]MDE2922297.1 30S ribosomal protein S20 [Acidobacteriota bacterium]MDE3265202.1 30S ribosomal protein S20 [Acidobacteriota bacterium]
MANSKQAERRIRQSLIRRDRNRAAMSRLRTSIKQLRTAADGDVAKARELLPATLSLIDATARKGVIHTNAAARRKSRLTRLVNRRVEAAAATAAAESSD